MQQIAKVNSQNGSLKAFSAIYILGKKIVLARVRNVMDADGYIDNL